MPCFGCCNMSDSGKDIKDAIERLEDIDLETLERRTSSVKTDSSIRWESRILPGYRRDSSDTASPVSRKRCASLDTYNDPSQIRVQNTETKSRRLKFTKSNSIH